MIRIYVKANATRYILATTPNKDEAAMIVRNLIELGYIDIILEVLSE